MQSQVNSVYMVQHDPNMDKPTTLANHSDNAEQVFHVSLVLF